MAASEPKQYLPINNEPMLLHTLRRLSSHPQVVGLVVVLAADDRHFSSLDISALKSGLPGSLSTVIGGASRSESVVRGLEKIAELAFIPEADKDDPRRLPWVLVHDAARPCIRHSDIDALLSQVDDQGGLLGLEVTDTLWQQDDQRRCLRTLPRDQLMRAQTPQLFPLTGLLAALRACHRDDFQPTDEAEAMRHSGYAPRLIGGSADNIKVTRAGDLALAEFYLQQQQIAANTEQEAVNRQRGQP